MPESLKRNFIYYPIQRMPSVQVIASGIIKNYLCYDANTLIPRFSVHFGLLLFNRQKGPIYLFTRKRIRLLGYKEELTSFFHYIKFIYV